ncbi:MAG: helix-turn-helix transcriptional regulator [Solirubrobacterales bacterium]|nr:helix-turn-helix transcriptional regulator [Solirubrobacterales bacterium]
MEERHFRALFEVVFAHSASPMLLFDDGQTVVDANPAALRLLGREARGELLEALVAPEDRDHHGHDFALLLESGNLRGRRTIVEGSGDRREIEFCARAHVAPGRHLAMILPVGEEEDGVRDDEGERPALSARETQVVELLALGETGEQVAQRLHLSPETVRTHVRNAMGKVGARTRAHLVVRAIEEGLVHVE